MKVLVLENSRLYQKTLRELLEEVDCEVDCATSSEHGTRLLDNNSYDFIIAGQNIFDDSNILRRHLSRTFNSVSQLEKLIDSNVRIAAASQGAPGT